jgi:hypothetical protein
MILRNDVSSEKHEKYRLASAVTKKPERVEER